jgi:hypothetical protein
LGGAEASKLPVVVMRRAQWTDFVGLHAGMLNLLPFCMRWCVVRWIMYVCPLLMHVKFIASGSGSAAVGDLWTRRSRECRTARVEDGAEEMSCRACHAPWCQ